MVRLCISILLILTVSPLVVSTSDPNNQKEDFGWFSKLATYFYDKLLGSTNSYDEAVDVGRALVASKVKTTDLTSINDRIRGFEFDKFDEETNNFLKEGMPIKEFDEYFRAIAFAHGLPEKFILEVTLGKSSNLNQSNRKEFLFGIEKDSTVKYCIVATAKNGENKINFAMAIYSLNFKIADRVFRHSEQQTLLGFIPWGTRHHTTYEPRKLSTDDQDIFFKFLQQRAIHGYIEQYPHLALPDKSHDEM